MLLVLLIPQGVIGVHVLQDRKRPRQPWLGYFVVNEALVLLGGALQVGISQG